ncbi:hypothetical protein [Dyadobacter sp. CY326]|uniref:hypothetical protein n=1 Tax=Dyadobacter sp. CY326 TaxID=2907300 RepID=UPI001F4793E3|nr:hypothetical protein [Dyadobacter sp. CY326]MCE7064870.1 hypothetical protein [Dyadobacter sp. CY326]
MKSTLLTLALTLSLISCQKKNNVEPDIIIINPTNELVGTSWQRTLNPNLYNYLEFKTHNEVDFFSNYNGEQSTTLTSPYTLNRKNVIYVSNGFNYTGEISGDTMTVMGTAGPMIYVKLK